MNVPISIPPFPSQDLAKLVLGYLAEEQLMTAYDEFLQASPYLDAYGNEYDRIFMTSLKNILAEYRAVKIYVETCKPFILRRKLVQCPNLLEIVKFLVNNVDINKLHVQDDRAGPSRHHSLSKSLSCDVCTSLKLQSCVCKSTSQSTSHIETSSLENSVETTSLADLPGNTSYRKRIAKVHESVGNKSIISSSDKRLEGSENHARQLDDMNVTSIKNNKDVISSATEKSYLHNTNVTLKDYESDLRHTPQAYDNAPSMDCHNRGENVSINDDHSEAGSNNENRECAGTFQEFSTGVDSPTVNKVIVPDSSTSENNILQNATAENGTVEYSTNIDKRNTMPHILIRVAHENKNLSMHPNTSPQILPRFASNDVNRSTPVQNSPKITILSDIKVEKDIKMPSILKSATTQQMQTLFINGTPAYKQKQHQGYSQDEIMAMPTIILVPASGTSKKTVPSVTQDNMIENKGCPIAMTASTDENLGPLVIDVTSPDAASGENENQDDIVDGSFGNTNVPCNKNNRLLNTVDVISHMSLPKDNVLNSFKSSTPHAIPPTRKSSSTPRRTSHVRVLDFATPRRILQETVNEQDNMNPMNEVVHDRATSIPVNNTNNVEETTNNNNPVPNVGKEDTATSVSGDVTNGSAKENKATIKVYNWDAKLRALAYAGNGNVEKSETTKKKPKKSKKKVSPISDNKVIDTKTKKPTVKEIITPKTEKRKKKKSIEIKTNSVNEISNKDKVTISSVPMKPTINIICRNKRIQSTEIEKTQNKSNNSDEILDTPELERMSLQNEIGAKLNISELLETPYKQALYDIQMETPKFLGPDIPDVPLSDIKIMNIPTPRFLNTPKVTQNTPSSYSSRPTDYSSGGSYYKPDDQDYLLATEVMECALSMTVETKKSKTSKESVAVTDKNVSGKVHETKSRPVRQCTKNVSYNNYYNNLSNKAFDVNDDKVEKSSTCSDTIVNKTDKIDKPKVLKVDKDGKKEKKVEPKRKSKKYRSPTKKEAPKTFMKIKPRRTTPVKEVIGKGRKKTNDQSVYIKSQQRKLVSNNKSLSFEPEAAPISTKSRRKSSTPRKLHCTKIFNSESSDLNSSDGLKEISKSKSSPITNPSGILDSDTEQLALRWSDSQESEAKANNDSQPGNESDDISKIKEYINKTVPSEVRTTQDGEGTLQVDLIKRGFDVATARMIERDLLENSNRITPTQHQPIQCTLHPISPISLTINTDETESKKTSNISDSISENAISSTNNEQHKDEDENEFDLSVHESNEETNNYFSYQFNETTFVQTEQVKLKETFSMEICIEDEAIRLRATAFNMNFEQESQNENIGDCEDNHSENVVGPSSYDTLYTPRKAQCYEIFDSTLASLDTPLKADSPKADECEIVAEIVEVEKIETDAKPKAESKKRKRLQSELSNGNKKVKTDTPYLLNSTNIQNIDIESVLSKLHGP